LKNTIYEIYIICSKENNKDTEIIYLNEITRIKDFKIFSGELHKYTKKLIGKDLLLVMMIFISFVNNGELKGSL